MTYLVVPCLEPGMGGGHLSRCLALCASLREKGRDARLCVPPGCAEEARRRLAALGKGDDYGRIFMFDPAGGTLPSDFREPVIILDRFKTPAREFAAWSALGIVLGIDEGGPCRKRFDFLIDLLPSLPGRAEPNLISPNLLPLPGNRREDFPVLSKGSSRPARILVSFGAEDAAGLGSVAVRSLKKLGAQAEIEEARGVPNLKERLWEYDVVITHYGLTAFEAIAARSLVILASPTRFHERLARYAGFLSGGKGREGAARTAGLVFSPRLAPACRRLADRFGLDTPGGFPLGDILAEMPSNPRHCPCCGAQAGKGPVRRFGMRSYRRCPSCGVFYMLRLDPAPVEYGRDYFFDFYKKQYGKTYLEDFPNLINMAKRRLKIIRGIRNRHSTPDSQVPKTLLDIGCAYGPFLKAAAEEGFDPRGIDPAEDAVKFVREELGIPCFKGAFPEGLREAGLTEGGPFDVVSLWYVLEHFRYPGRALEEIGKLLRPGGVLAFSTPSSSGISGRTSLKRFLRQSPEDHWTVWSPRMAAALLGRYGFAVKRIVVTGHHPERFPLLGRFCKKGPLRALLSLASCIFHLGDTFEVYALSSLPDPPRPRLMKAPSPALP